MISNILKSLFHLQVLIREDSNTAVVSGLVPRRWRADQQTTPTSLYDSFTRRSTDAILIPATKAGSVSESKQGTTLLS